MNKRPELTEQTKRNLRTAFWSLYAQKPLEKISVREITALAGYNRGTFYLYYQDVYDLLNQIEDELLDELQQLLEQRLPGVLEHNLSEYMSFVVGINLIHAEYGAVLLSSRGDPRFAARFKELLAPVLRRYVLDGKGFTDTESELLLEYHLSGLQAMLARWLQDPGRMNLEQFVGLIIRMFTGEAPAPHTLEQKGEDKP